MLYLKDENCNLPSLETIHCGNSVPFFIRNAVVHTHTHIYIDAYTHTPTHIYFLKESLYVSAKVQKQPHTPLTVLKQAKVMLPFEALS